MTTKPPRIASIVPTPEGVRLASLLARVTSGDIKIPTFQRRPTVWNIDQVLDLFDSIMNGYPIGSLLFWLTHTALSSERNLGGFDLPDTPEKYPRNYVLDGQQRLTAIFAVITRQPENLDTRFKLVYDLRECVFVPFAPPLEAHHLRMPLLFDTHQYLAKQSEVIQLPDGAALQGELERAWETFREYVVPVVTIHDAPIEKVGTIFERINTRGTRLTIFDLMVAATWKSAKGQEFDLRDHVDSLLVRLADKDYDGVEDVTVLRTLAVVHKGSARREAIVRLRDESTASLLTILDKAGGALARAVDFLATEVAAKSSDFLPYERQLILLAYIMSQKQHLSASAVGTLRRWFWRTSFSERYRTGGEALFDEDLSVGLAALAHSSQLDRFGEAPTKQFFVSSQFRRSAAVALAFAALLGTHSPRNLTNGLAIDVGSALSEFNRKEFHHIFPQAFLKAQGVNPERINALANICMLTATENKNIGNQAPSIYLARSVQDLGQEEFDAVSESNLIPTAAIARALADDYDGFLDARAEHLAKKVAELV
ncbi:MAG: DUF262 domain-containing protein [Chloroflexi bacterium]|nr:DUF262 domain-containing protein [Chloroflexota bacterium]